MPNSFGELRENVDKNDRDKFVESPDITIISDGYAYISIDKSFVSFVEAHYKIPGAAWLKYPLMSRNDVSESIPFQLFKLESLPAGTLVRIAAYIQHTGYVRYFVDHT